MGAGASGAARYVSPGIAFCSSQFESGLLSVATEGVLMSAGMPRGLCYVIFLVWNALHSLFLPTICLSDQDLTLPPLGSSLAPRWFILRCNHLLLQR